MAGMKDDIKLKEDMLFSLQNLVLQITMRTKRQK